MSTTLTIIVLAYVFSFMMGCCVGYELKPKKKPKERSYLEHEAPSYRVMRRK